ncbi:MAG: Rne/Rng family ribonuclease [Alphaproteobacteria bacterium]
MGNKMLIDATHPEETRVVVLRGNRVDEFDFESAAKKQLRGNIYLAKVTRVEPSLQAAFVNYGGNRHGFLAFNEIHPDYYQLPLAERQALKAEDERVRKRPFDRDSDSGSENEDGTEIEDDAAEDASGEDENGDALAAAYDEDVEAHADDASDEEDEISSEETAVALEAALPPMKYSKNLYEDTGFENSDTEEEVAEDNAGSETAASEAAANNDAESSDNAQPPVDAVAPETAEASIEAAQNPGSSDAEASSSDEVANSADAVKVAENGDGTENNGNAEEGPENGDVESVGSEDAMEELPERVRRRRRPYKIQEVIKRGQIILVQVVKEERGNKGAALTTYLSLAGRYTVLMPNTGSGGGISRKISSPGDRKRLREIADGLDVSEGMGLIIRTAGAARTKTEIKRDYEYLLRLWENVRDYTLKSSAPALVYEEGDLIKRTIRDLYSREIDEVLVAGDAAYRDAKDFMRMLMPSHAKNVQAYTDAEPVFTRYEVERQLNAMFSPQVTLPSGGYIVINQTEALVAVDVNSGKATREFSIEDTALKTNLEAAEELSRQLRLRDLAGLIVVDFIDMEEKRNNRAVERRLKECLRNDRARIQVGHISHFGLLEMSRQRLRTGMIEGSTTQCPHCQGTGVIRSTESVALSVLRSLEDWLRTNPASDLNAVTSLDVTLYILNNKRNYLHGIEERYDVTLTITSSERMQGSNFYIEKVSTSVSPTISTNAITQSDRIILPFEDEDTGAEDEGDEENRSQRNKRRRRRRGRGRGGENVRLSVHHEHTYADAIPSAETEDGEVAEDSEDSENADRAATGESSEESTPTRRRRGRRGGRQQRALRASRRRTPREGEVIPEALAGAEQPDVSFDTSETFAGRFNAGEAQPDTSPAEDVTPVSADPVVPSPHPGSGEQPIIAVPAFKAVAETAAPSPAPRRRRTNGAQRAEAAPAEAATAAPAVSVSAPAPELEVSATAEIRPVETSSKENAEPTEEAVSEVKSKPRGSKRGWWQRRAAE